MAFEERKEMLDIKTYECVAQNCKISGLPDEIIEICKNGYVLYAGEYKFKLFTYENFKKIMKKLSDGGVNRRVIHEIYSRTENIEDEHGLFLTIFHICKGKNTELSLDTTFHLKITTYKDTVEIKVSKITD